ncbi:MAG: SEL1-like repeat protein [Alphaproteobacteria bacterium]|nr:SEL1-like repeat protein [Alphaproteobacteria bacterium]
MNRKIPLKPFYFLSIFSLLNVIVTFTLPATQNRQEPEIIDNLPFSLKPQALYSGNYLIDKEPKEIQSIGLQGYFAKQKGDYAQAVNFLEQAARYKHFPSMIQLGELCEAQGYLEAAARWYVLAFQENWLENGTHFSAAKNKLEALAKTYVQLESSTNKVYKKRNESPSSSSSQSTSHSHELSQSINLFLSNIISQKFFTFFPLQGHKALYLGVLADFYRGSQRPEPYLSKDECDLKATRYKDLYYSKASAEEQWIYAQELCQKGYYQKAVPYLEQSRTPKAIYNIGFLHYEGILGAPNYRKAAEYFEKSATSDGWFNLGIMYCENKLGPPNYRKAAKCYEKSDKPEGWFNLATLHADGKLGAPDYQKAEKYLLQSGSPKAFYKLGILYFEEKLGKAQYKKAEKYFLASKLPEALEKVGCLYRDGKLGKASYPKAEKYFMKAKTPTAFFNLGVLYGDDKYGFKNYHKAEEYYIKSDLPDAFLNLGILKLTGKLGKPDYPQIIELLTRANLPEAWHNLGLLYSSEELGAPDYKRSAECYQKANFSPSWYNLSYLYDSGKLGTPNYKRIEECLKQSGSPEALSRLGFLYMSRNLGTPDYQKALRYFEEANIPEAKIGLIYMYKLRSTQLSMDKGEITAKIAALKEQLRGTLANLESSYQHYILGHLAFLENNLPEALLHFSQALALGDQYAQDNIKQIEDILYLQHKKESCENALTQEMLNVSSIPLKNSEEEKNLINKEHTNPSLGPDQPPFTEEESKQKNSALLEENQTGGPIESTSEAISTVDSTFPSSRDKVTRIKSKLKRYNIKLQKKLTKAQHYVPHFKALDKVDTPISRKLKIIFPSNDAEVEKDFRALQKSSSKINDLLQDIEYKPWATYGTGKPEVLKGKFKGYKGCISRRIDHKNRLIYKILGPRKILILSSNNHYD